MCMYCTPTFDSIGWLPADSELAAFETFSTLDATNVLASFGKPAVVQCSSL